MAAALRHAGRTEHATRWYGRTGRSGSHQAAVRGLPGRVASARSGGGWQPQRPAMPSAACGIGSNARPAVTALVPGDRRLAGLMASAHAA
jgi:hypothetical protein